MTKSGVALTAGLIVASAVAAYLYGLSVARQASGRALVDAQLILSFNHMERYEELLDCMRGGQIAEAEEKLSQQVITQQELVASLLQGTNSIPALEYIRIRSGRPLEELRSFKSERGTTWSEPACTGARGGA